MSKLESDRGAEEAEIDGLKFTCHKGEPLELYAMSPRVMKIIAGVLPHVTAIGGGLTKEAVEKMFSKDIGQLAPVLKEVANALGDKENANLPQELLKRCTVALPIESKKTDEDEEDESEDEEETAPKTRTQSLTSSKEINAVFRGRFFTMIKVMWFCLGVQFSDFLSSGSEKNPSKA